MTIAAAIYKLTDLRKSSALRGIAGVFALRMTITILNFALISLAARVLGVSAFGTYSILFSAAGLFSIVATAGQQVLVMRFWNEYSSAGQMDCLKGALIFSSLVCLAGSVLVAIPLYVWLIKAYDAPIAMAITLYLIALSALLTTSHLVRTAVGVGTGDGFGNLSLAIPPIVYLLHCLGRGAIADVSVVFFLMALGAASCVVFHIVTLWRTLQKRFPGFMMAKATYNIPSWRARSFKLWLSNSLEASNQYIDVLIIGALMNPEVAGAYFVTSRLANAFSMATDAIHMFSTRHIPDLYYRRQFTQLGSLLDTVSGVTLAVIVAGMIVIAGGGHWILMAFSSAYVPYHDALIVLSLGMAAVAAAGPSGSILMLTGHEGRYLGVIGITVLLRMTGFLILIPHFQVMGAVVATTLSFACMAVLLRASTVSSAKIDGSILRLISRYWRQPAITPAE
ncbi:lipopolysaccharide biosynthesis protein [Bradyrhizobium sp. SYSU BS000235]|uniref:lipopolysaccharide biosynthesis protein n=1 Tax=Bradyrhizobium sp. SYSU BS000235 TaxID=3411332 RepID=UPI003C74DC74